MFLILKYYMIPEYFLDALYFRRTAINKEIAKRVTTGIILDITQIDNVVVYKGRFREDNYIQSATYEDSTGERELTDSEIERLQEIEPDWYYQQIQEAWQ